MRQIKRQPGRGWGAVKQRISLTILPALIGLLALTAARLATAATVHNPEDGDFFDAYVTEQYLLDDNLFRVPAGAQYFDSLVGPGSTRNDRINVAILGLEGQWTGSRQAIALDAHVNDNRYTFNTRLDNVSGFGNVVWDWRAGALWTGEVGATLSRGLASFQSLNFYGRDLVDSIQSFANASFQISPNLSLVGGVAQTTVSQGVVSQRINDFRNAGGNVGMSYATAEDTTFGVNYEFAKGVYPTGAIIDFRGLEFNRDYKADIVRFLVTSPVGATIMVKADAGYEKRVYATDNVGAISGAVWRVDMNWQATAITALKLDASRQITAYLDAESTYFISTRFSAAPTYNPTERIAVALALSTEKQAYFGPSAGIVEFASRRDSVSGEQATLTYTPRTHLSFTLNAGFQQRASNFARYEFTDRLLSAAITGRF